MAIQQRIASIDVFRALTMFLMIFVNDLWTLVDIPRWLGHTEANEDGMGLSDVVFPAFLFIVGLSIPIALSNRIKREQSYLEIIWHILSRSFALIMMGFFMVNLENINGALLPIPRQYWQLSMALAIFLIWSDYRKPDGPSTSTVITLKSVGVLILAALAWIYAGGSAENPTWMKPHWWGILGLIGWSYLVTALVYLLVRNRIWLLAIVFVIFNALNLLEVLDLQKVPSLQLVVSASNYACTMGGVLVSVIMFRLNKNQRGGFILIILPLMAALLITYGFYIRPWGGISKILATPSWTAVCTGISIAALAAIHLLADVWKLRGIFTPIRAAGTSTLTCYLVPYFYYPLLSLSGLYLPIVLRTGAVGIIKSLLFALLIIQITGILERLNVRLKI